MQELFKIISIITLIIAVIGFIVELVQDIRSDRKQNSPQKQVVTYKYKSRLPRFYCPHCGDFRRRLQITADEWDGGYYCKACGSVVTETEFMFRQWLKETFKKADRERAKRAARTRRVKQYKNLGGNGSMAQAIEALQRTEELKQNKTPTPASSPKHTVYRKSSKNTKKTRVSSDVFLETARTIAFDNLIDASSLSDIAPTTKAQSVIDQYLNEQLLRTTFAKRSGHTGLRDED